jgi:hypothetical protein
MDGDVLMFAQVMTVIVMSTASFVLIGFGGVYLWRKSSPRKHSAGTPHDDERLQRLETAVDTIAIEVERISEAQRFMVGLLSDPATARRGELARPDSSGRVVTPH